LNTSMAASEGNGLLAGLPPREREGLLGRCELVDLAPDDVLGEPGERIRHAYFPTRGFAALLAEVDGHEALALGLVGSEGMLGVPLALGLHTLPWRTRVQSAGGALRIVAAELARALAVSPVLERRLRRYLGGRLEQLARTAACASFHVVGTRLAYWLLMAHDRAHGDRFYLTHDRLAHLLGVRRSGVTTAAGMLHALDLVHYVRGNIVVLNRVGLERAACSCYRADHEVQLAAPRAELLRAGALVTAVPERDEATRELERARIRGAP
jgi:CRP-like cAMP-binding protein